jgi:AcrR family transcriptional regulator
MRPYSKKAVANPLSISPATTQTSVPAPSTPVATRRRSRGRPPVISSERLLEVAREVFLELGIRATTSEVASRAGIAEGTIFHRFKSKEELFRAAMNFDPDAALVLVEELLARGDGSNLRATLVEFAERFIAYGRVAMPVMMMSWSNPESQMCAERTSERVSRYERVLAALGNFFAAQMAAGRMRPVEPEIMSRMLIGSLHHFCMSELLMARATTQLSHQVFAEQVVDVLLASGSALEAQPAAAVVGEESR